MSKDMNASQNDVHAMLQMHSTVYLDFDGDVIYANEEVLSDYRLVRLPSGTYTGSVKETGGIFTQVAMGTAAEVLREIGGLIVFGKVDNRDYE